MMKKFIKFICSEDFAIPVLIGCLLVVMASGTFAIVREVFFR